MSTRFEKKIIMPHGSMGPTTLMNLSDDELKSVERWHRKEWDEFRIEITAHKNRILNAVRDTYLCNRERFRSKKHQRGSIMVGAVGSSNNTAKIIPPEPSECSFTTSTIPSLLDFDFNPATTRCLARLHTDGDWYSSTGSTSFGASEGTWQGSCEVSEYDSRWNRISGDVPAYQVSGSDGTWSDASVTGAALGYEQINTGIKNGSFNVEIRDATTLNVLFTDAFNMTAETDSGC